METDNNSDLEVEPTEPTELDNSWSDFDRAQRDLHLSIHAEDTAFEYLWGI
jgi:hypothetical protein